MKCLLASVFALLLFSCGGNQPETDPAINIPSTEVGSGNTIDITAGIDRADQEVCRVNMQTAATAIVVYQAQNGTLPESLGQLSGIPARCPDGQEYVYTVENGSWKLECPAAQPHGCIENGSASW